MKHNSLIHNYFVEKQPAYPGVASKGLTSTQNTGFLTPNGDICRLLQVFCACKSLSWADIVAILSSINDKKDTFLSSINDKVARVRNSVRTPRQTMWTIWPTPYYTRSYFIIFTTYPIIESAVSNGLVSSTSKVCPSTKIHLSIVPEYFNVQIIFSLCMIVKDL